MASSTTRLWLRWSWRDLRARWLLVLAIATIIALGTGAYAGLGSTAAWRRQSNDESFAMLGMHDLRVTLAQGATVEVGALDAAVRDIPHGAAIAATAERLVGVTEVDASSADETVLVPGEIVGIDVAAGEVQVDAVHVFDGRALVPADDGQMIGVLEHQFAEHYGLPPSGTLQVSGGTALRYVGVGTAPQHFIVTSRSMSVFAQAGLAVLFVPLGTAQQLLDQPGKVNEVALRLAPGADRDAVEADLRAALEAPVVGAGEAGTSGATITVREDEPAYRMLYEDIEGDQRFWNIIAALIFAGATFAAFSLITRIVEAQRREIGIGMALGLPSWQLAIRPVLIGAQIAVAGAVTGLAFGLLLDLWLKSVFQAVLPMPVFRTPFQPWVFARAAAIGFALPLVATIVPVWRAVRVQPVDAIRTGHLAARRAARSRMGWLELPGRSYHRLPVRNLVRTPRRTAITALAIGASITTMVFTIGLIDSFVRTMDETERELTHGSPARSAVELETFLPVQAPQVVGIGASPSVARAEPGLRLFGSIGTGDDVIDLIVDLLDFRTAAWTPTLAEGSRDAVLDGGLVLSRKAAEDLEVRVGDTVRLHHPERAGVSYRMVDTEVLVAAIHPSPMRFPAYFDLSRATLFGMEGLTNLVQVTPAPGVSDEELLREVFALPGVGSVQSVTAATTLFKDALEEYFGVLRVAELIVLALALLIAFNAASISIDERAREHATMQAFGLRPRTVLALVTVETVLIGAIGTVLGIVAGRGLLGWMTDTQMDQTVPDVGVIPSVSPATLVTAFVLGVGAVAVAPLLTARRVSGVDIPSTLRVVE